jgi:energy-coupling factor transport system permease protein
MRDISFGQYYPASSPMHRLDPRTKILMVVVYIAMIFFVDSYAGYLAVLILLAAAVALSRVPVRLMLKSLKPILFLVLFSVILNLFFVKGTDGENFIIGAYDTGTPDLIFSWWRISMYFTGVDFALKMALRLMLLVMGPSLLTLTTTPVSLTDGIESLLKPLRLVRFPVHEFALIMSIALRLIPTVMEETDKIILAQKARCADFDSRNIFKKARALLPVLIPLFVSSVRRADELAYAMDSRCYRGSEGRTKMKILRLRRQDLAAGIILLAFFFAVLVLKYNFFGISLIGLLV